MARLPVKKTYKLYIGGAFPRSESGRTYEAEGQNVARASRKDVRDAVVAARAAQPKWAGATAYNRGQVLYRVAEMMEARVAELAELSPGATRCERAIDRWVWYAGFADKLAQVLGSSNPVAGPYFNFTCRSRPASSACSRPTSRRCSASSRGSRRRSSAATPSSRRLRVRAARRDRAGRGARDERPPGRRRQPAHGLRAELAPWLASHMDVNAIDLTGADGARPDLERAAAENVKRVVHGAPDTQSLYEISAFLELKTVWHPIGV